ncbi:Inner membrane metabolite transport protein YhjE [Arthrobacter saudimassiliensis]|uniref:Putative proline/betaine transporter n=1 Tax=Arthrobacter saudimassiliensis TaxID=1461584 RepID=A0A078MT22_9MICC|nr:Inner membrane metabolite transport protein YhjE [Arthrobacter saudimassiliensis]
MSTLPTLPPGPAPATRGSESLNTPQMKRILASSFLGSAIEFYDFMLYASASALVFSQVFFASLSPGMATVASFGTLAAGYVARPLGGIVFGHFGDRLGRKGVLVTTMLLMGIATALIGLLPTYEQIGLAAPLALVALRIIQGFAVGGEWGGAMLIALEHAPGGKRGFAASFANLGAPAGSILSAGVLGLFSLLPEDQFLSWGWRIPFLLSVVLVLIGMFVRLKVVESPMFVQFDREAEERRVPLIAVLSKSPKVLVLGTLVAVSQLTISGMASVWGLSHATAQGVDQTFALNAKVASALALFLTTLLAARLSDRWGRRPVIGVGIAGAILLAYPLLLMIDAGDNLLFGVAVIAAQAVQGIILGPLAAFLAELFPTAVRFTGSSLAFQGASALGAGFTPIFAGALAASAGGLPALGGTWIAVLAACAVALFVMPESSKRDLTSIR